MRAELLAFLLGDANVASLSGGRGSWGWRKQGDPIPAFVLTRTDGKRDATLEGYSGLVETRVQLDAFGPYQADAAALAAACVARLAQCNAAATDAVIQGVFVDGETDTFEGEAPDRIFRTRLDLRVHNTEA